MKLSTAVNQFLTEAGLRLARATVTAYESDLNLLVSLATVKASDSVLAFTPELAQEYLLSLSRKGLSMSTLHRRRSSLAEFGRWGVRKRLWAHDPMADVTEIRRPKHLPRPFTVEERQRLLALELATPAERLIRALLYYTGLRVSPVCGIRLQDVSEGDGAGVIGTIRTRG